MKKQRAMIALTPNGKVSALKLQSLIGGDVHLPSKLKGEREDDGSFYYEEPFRSKVGELMGDYEEIVFLMATGIVVRTISSFLKDKSRDPAIVVMDENLNYSISLLSGHVGGANRLAKHIAEKTGAIPVITTSTDVNQKTAWDIVAKEWKAYSYDDNDKYKALNFAEVSAKKVIVCLRLRFKSGLEEILERNGVEGSRITDDIELAVEKAGNTGRIVLFTDEFATMYRNRRIEVGKGEFELGGSLFFPVIKRQYAVGIGCRKGISIETLREQFLLFLKHQNIHSSAIGLLCSIEIKKEEEAIVRLAEECRVPFQTYTKEEIRRVEPLIQGMERSDFVFRNVGVYNVSHSCAYLSGEGEVIAGKTKYVQSTFSVSKLAERFELK